MAITVLLVLLYFGIHWLAHRTGAYLSPSFHLRPEIAPPLICSDLNTGILYKIDREKGTCESFKYAVLR